MFQSPQNVEVSLHYLKARPSCGALSGIVLDTEAARVPGNSASCRFCLASGASAPSLMFHA